MNTTLAKLLSIIGLLVFLFLAPFNGAAKSIPFSGNDLHSHDITHKEKLTSGSALPVKARGKIERQLRGRDYEVNKCENKLPSGKKGVYWASNRKHNLEVFFNRHEILLLPHDRDERSWHLGMTLAGYGYGEKLENVQRAKVDGIKISGSRVEYKHGVLREWYVNDEHGLEQGVTLTKPPARKSAGPLTVEWEVSGSLEPQLSQEGDTIEFSNMAQQAVLRYSGLKAWDAKGRSLPAKLSVKRSSSETSPARIAYVVDDSRASYPITVDPLFTKAAKMIPAGGEDDHFAYSASASGDIVVVGAYGDGDNGYNAGAAYIFYRDAGGADNWGQVKKITANDGEALDYFGYSVAICGDTVVVGAYEDDDKGAAYIFKQDEGGIDNWGQVQKITASDGFAEDAFGYSVAISVDTVVVGAHHDDVNGDSSGAAYIFYRDQGGPDNWGEVKKITAGDGEYLDIFGHSVAISVDTVVVGAPYEDEQGQNKGAAYIFNRHEGGADHWGEVKKIMGSDCVGAGADEFGWSVSIDENILAVGARQWGSAVGAAYIFYRNEGGTGNWGEVQKIIASDGAPDDCFGVSVSISGDTIVVGANQYYNFQIGYAYILYRNQGGADNWGEVSKIIPDDGADRDEFGGSVAISGDRLIVGAHLNDDNETDSGASYVYYRDEGGFDSWGQVKKIIGRGGAAGDEFGCSVSISEDTVVVGAHLDEWGAFSDSGSAYVFYRDESDAQKWLRVKNIGNTALANDDFFGCSVSISGDTVVAGAKGYLNDDGGAFIYYRDQGGADNWGQVKLVRPSEGFGDDNFGCDVSISGDALLVGAYRDNYNGASAGSAYVFYRDQDGADNWGRVKLIRPTDGDAYDYFGYAVAVDGDTAVVGAYMDDENGTYSGSAYMSSIAMQGGTDNWGQVKKITPSDIAAYDNFGYSVAISGDRVVVGSPYDDDLGSNSGSAYIFYRDQGGTDNWGQVKKVTATDGVASDYFGRSVHINGDILSVGATGVDDNGALSGAAYSFDRNQGGINSWGEVQKITASDGVESDYFGRCVAIGDGTLVVGADGGDANGIDSGAAYVYTAIEVCECDLSHDGSCNILDWPYFIEDWGRTTCGTPPGSGNLPNDCECDLNLDGSCNILDWPFFIEDWGRTDCP
jgi:hypothetical protein